MRAPHPFARACALAGLICSASASADGAKGPSKPSGYAAVESGQLVRYKYKQEDWRYSWRQRAYVELGTEMLLSERFTVRGGLSAFMWYNTFPKERNGDNLNFDEKHVSLDIARGDGIYVFGDPARPAAELGVGIYPYKYNPDARNLGEYLFRSGAYPNFIQGDFDYAMAKLTGTRLGKSVGSWRNDLMLTTETDIWPHFDLDLSYVTAWSPFSFLDVGGGFSLTNLVSVDEDKTTPDPAVLKARNGDAQSRYVGYVEGGDTLFYTFRSLKLMGRFALKPAAFFGSGRLGPEDLKLYGEVAVLGWKNYPLPANGLDTLQQYSYLADRGERIPVMFGFNVPAFKLLDVLSVEAEWYGLKGPNSYRDRKEDGFPLPQSPTYWSEEGDRFGKYEAGDYVGKDDWKWSVYARKTLIPGLQVTAQVARDHVRHNFDSPIQLDREEALTKPDNWWWVVKLAFFY